MTPQSPFQFAHGKALIDEATLAQIGQGKIAYLRPILSQEVNRLFPEAPKMEPGLNLWALLNADGSPIMLTDSHDVAMANAREHSLAAFHVH
jgi:hypothetical protein